MYSIQKCLIPHHIRLFAKLFQFTICNYLMAYEHQAMHFFIIVMPEIYAIRLGTNFTKIPSYVMDMSRFLT